VDQPWTKLLAAAERGDGIETRALAVGLAAEVLASPLVVLAHEILAGGPLATSKAIQLAERLLEAASGEDGTATGVRP
jgi:hypothetical protein